MRYFLPDYWTVKRQQIALGVTAFFLLAGAVQVAFDISYVLTLTPVLLALITAMMLVVWDVALRTKTLIAAAVLVAGYVVELIGVHTGWLFGDYTYGTGLGFKAFGVPLAIGLAWFIVTLSAWHIVGFGKRRGIVSFLLAGGLVVMFDLLLEQFAIVYGLWSWQGGDVPLYNYLCWFGISLVFFGLYQRFTRKAEPSLFIAGQLPLLALFFWTMLLLK